MIASPGDVAPARRIAHDVIHEWNAINAKDRKIILTPVGWETHASPEMGDRPQAIINGQLLKDTDLLVAVFWTRLGSPTGTAPSGTVEEIEEHLAAGKPAMIYFSMAPVRPDSVDDDQYSALKAFKESLRPKGLTEEWEDLSEFRTKFSRQLAQMVIRRFTPDLTAVVDTAPFPKPRLAPRLNEPARELLVEASQDQGGIIMRLETLQGSHVETNNRDFVVPGDVKTAARWRGALSELNALRLVEDRAGKGELFFVTDEGYRVADLLKEQ
jgi:hypothetical protein